MNRVYVRTLGTSATAGLLTFLVATAASAQRVEPAFSRGGGSVPATRTFESDSVVMRFWAKPADRVIEAASRQYASVFKNAEVGAIVADILFPYDPAVRFAGRKIQCTIQAHKDFVADLPDKEVTTATRVGEKWVFAYIFWGSSELGSNQPGVYAYDCHVNQVLVASGAYEVTGTTRPPESAALSSEDVSLRAWIQPRNDGRIIAEEQRLMATPNGRQILSPSTGGDGGFLMWELFMNKLPVDEGYYGPTSCYYVQGDSLKETRMAIVKPSAAYKVNAGYASFLIALGGQPGHVISLGRWPFLCRRQGRVLTRFTVIVSSESQTDRGGAGASPTSAAPTPGNALIIEKVAGDGQVILKGGWQNFSVRVRDQRGTAVQGVKVAWTTPAGGPLMYVGVTGPDGMTSATNLYAMGPGEFEQVAALVSLDTPQGMLTSPALTTLGPSIRFRFTVH